MSHISLLSLRLRQDRSENLKIREILPNRSFKGKLEEPNLTIVTKTVTGLDVWGSAANLSKSDLAVLMCYLGNDTHARTATRNISELVKSTSKLVASGAEYYIRYAECYGTPQERWLVATQPQGILTKTRTRNALMA